MISFSDWFPPAIVGVSFVTMAIFKFYGLARGIEGGAGKPAMQRLCGT